MVSPGLFIGEKEKSSVNKSILVYFNFFARMYRHLERQYDVAEPCHSSTLHWDRFRMVKKLWRWDNIIVIIPVSYNLLVSNNYCRPGGKCSIYLMLAD